MLVGKATDRSGFGGAAFSSLVLDEADAEANKGAVQVPDPFLKNVHHARVVPGVRRASRRRRLTVGFKDLGAGGIMGCTAELVGERRLRRGRSISIECPTSQPDLPPAVIAVGETQERLGVGRAAGFTPELLAIYNEEFRCRAIARGARAAVIGKRERGAASTCCASAARK